MGELYRIRDELDVCDRSASMEAKAMDLLGANRYVSDFVNKPRWYINHDA